jgi:hypothetical protein
MFIIQLYTSFSSFINVISVDGVHMLPSVTTETTHIIENTYQPTIALLKFIIT